MQIKTTQISASDYQKLLKKIQNQIDQTKENIFNNVTRQKVEMAWNVGKIIEMSLVKKDEKTYGAHLITKLEQDTKIGQKVLYKMRNFYKTYPKIPKDDAKLNWSHYRVLSGIKKADERKYLEDLTRENSWDSDQLQKEVSKSKTLPNKTSKPIKKTKIKKIQPTRGKLFTYKIVEIEGSNKQFFDCGFKIYREVKEDLAPSLKKDGAVVLVKKSDKDFAALKSAANLQQLHTYKAYLKRVVDGDTLHANIDLGFGIFHEEIIRLAKINSAESKTAQGKKAAKELEKLLKSVPFLILKSIKTDIFNRYVADIFLPQNKQETDLQKVADNGIYLNQILLDRGLAEIF